MRVAVLLIVVAALAAACGDGGTRAGDRADVADTLEGFFEAFNAADNDALQDYCNYPHAFVGGGGSIRIVEDRWEMNFARMREREEWRRSTVDSADAFFETRTHSPVVR